MKIILDTEDEKDYELIRQMSRLPEWKSYVKSRFGADPEYAVLGFDDINHADTPTFELPHSEVLEMLASEIRFQEERLEKQDRAISLLARSPLLTGGNLTKAFDEITEIISQTLEVQRVGIWLMNHDLTGNYCINQYDSHENVHTQGASFEAKDYPIYFEAIQTREAIVANDVYTHPSTQEYIDSYLKIFGITSMLDIPIWRNGQMIGMICHEHVGTARIWQKDEQFFGIAVADLIALVFESKERLDLIERLQNTEEELSATNHHLEQALEEANQAMDDLSTAQAQLIENEKMAALGQLITSMAHEFNTPVGAIKSSTRNMVRAIPELVRDLPEILIKLQADEKIIFSKMIEQMLNVSELLSSSEEKKYKKEIAQWLEQQGLTSQKSENTAVKLVRMGIVKDLEPYLPILLHDEADSFTDALYLLGLFIKNIITIERSIDKTYKVVQALKSYKKVTEPNDDEK